MSDKVRNVRCEAHTAEEVINFLSEGPIEITTPRSREFLADWLVELMEVRINLARAREALAEYKARDTGS